MAEEYYQIGPDLRGIDFYQGGTNAVALLSIESNVSSSALTIKSASSSIAVNVSLSSSAIKIANAQSVSNILLEKFVVSIEILNILSDIDINVNTSVAAYKITKASSVISINSSCLGLITKTAQASSSSKISIGINSLGTVLRLVNPSTQHINVSLEAVPKEILTAIATVAIISSCNTNQPIRFSPNFIDSGSILTLLVLDGFPITNHGRSLDSSINPVYVQNQNWNSRTRRYYKRSGNGGRRTFSINWQMLPNYKNKTVDNRHARDFLNSIAEDPDVHVLKIINQDASGTTPTTESSHYVFVSSYSEELVRRDLVDGVYYFNCSLTLEEA